MWPFVEQVLQASFLLWELVVDLSDVHRLQIGIAVARVGLANVHKQVLVELGRPKCITGDEQMPLVRVAKLTPWVGPSVPSNETYSL